MNSAPYIPSTLALTTPCYEDESFLGYLARTAELNAAKVSMVTALAGWTFQHDSKLARIGKHSAEICTVIGLDARDFDRMAIVPTNSGRRHAWFGFGGQTVRPSAIDFHRPKYCPLCLDAAPYRRRRWDLSLYTECHVHRVSMLDACPCGAQLAWNKALAVSCGRCGENLAKVRTSDSPTGALHMSEAIARAAPTTEQELALWSADPKSPKLAGICDLITFAGGWKLLGGNAALSMWRMTLSERRRLVEAAHSLVHGDDENARIEFFSALMRRPAAGASVKLREIFPKFYAGLYSYDASPGLQPLRERFEEFVRRDSGLDLAAVGQRHIVAQKMPDAYVAVGTASQETGIPHRKLKRMMAANGVSLRKVQTGKKTIVLIPRDKLHAMVEMLKNDKKFDPRVPLGEILGTNGRGYLTPRQFGERWALSPAAAWDCLKDGPIPYVQTRWKGRCMVSAIASADFERAIKRRVTRRHGVQTQSAKKALRGLQSAGFSAGKMFRRLFAGELMLAAIDEKKKGLDKLILHEDDVHDIRRSFRLARQGTFIDAHEVSARLKVTNDIVHALCRQGFLTPQRKTSRGRRILCEPSDVEKFAETYVRTKEIGRRIDKHLSARFIAEHGLHPVIRAKRVRYYLRQDVEDFVVNLPIRLAQGEGLRDVSPAILKASAYGAPAELPL